MPVTPSPQVISELAPTGVAARRDQHGEFSAGHRQGRRRATRPACRPTWRRRSRRGSACRSSSCPYERPGQIADDAENGKWDIGNIGAEPQRAAVINFTAAYCEIEATYLVPAGSPIRSVAEVDQPGRRVAVTARSAYGLWLENNYNKGELLQFDNADAAIRAFTEQKMDAYAGLRPGLIDVAAKLPGSRILDGQFTAVQQAIGTPKKNAAGVRVPARFCRGVEEERPDREPDRTARRRSAACRSRRRREEQTTSVIPAQAGIQRLQVAVACPWTLRGLDPRDRSQ